MNESDAIQICPALAEALRRFPSGRPALVRLLQAGLGGVIEGYLADAPVESLVTFLKEVQRVNLDRVILHRRLVQTREEKTLRADEVEPVSLVTLERQADRAERDRRAGLESLARGEWASVAFSGGAGTRFFSSLSELDRALAHPNQVLESETRPITPDLPKGVFPISPVGGLSFYEIFIAEALACGVETGRLPRVLLLTSNQTHQRTLTFLSETDLWGFPDEGWEAFRQAEEPRLDPDQNLIVADPAGHLSWTGDGHGGVYRALLAGGQSGSLLTRLSARGVRHLVMHNVDNPAARPFHPTRLGFHLNEQALFTVSAVQKTDPQEKVGLLMRLKSSGRVEVVEYNLLDPRIAAARDPDTNRLLHEAGNTNTNLVALEAIGEEIQPTIYTGKKVPSRRGPVLSSSMEMLNQHITRLLDPERVRAYQVPRPDFFMPTKNVIGVDSVESTTRMLSETHAGRLREAGAQVASSALVDLHPACGSTGGQLERMGIGPGWKIGEGARTYLCLHSGEDEAPVSEGSLAIGAGATLILDGARPWGAVRLDRQHNLELDRSEASRVRIGRGVLIREGVRVAFHVGAGGRLTIPAGRVIDRDLEGEVMPGEDREL